MQPNRIGDAFAKPPVTFSEIRSLRLHGGYDMTPQRITWMETALQGLASWIGHRRALFRHYPLPEGALVAEAFNLLQANKPDDLILKPEYMYKNLLSTGRLPEDISGQARADLIICNADARQAGRGQNISDHVKFVFEKKRGDAPNHLINEDLRRLQSFLVSTRSLPSCGIV